MTWKCEGFFIDRQKIVFIHRLDVRKATYTEMRQAFISFHELARIMHDLQKTRINMDYDDHGLRLIYM